jgi:hypothetical protein
MVAGWQRGWWTVDGPEWMVDGGGWRLALDVRGVLE